MRKAHSVIGFHAGPACRCDGIGEFWKTLYDNGRPIFHKSSDHYGTCFELIRDYQDYPDVVFRLSTRGQNDGYDYDVPPYKDPKFDNDPYAAFDLHWAKTKAALPVEFDKRVWLEVMNEVDKNYSQWLAEFALYGAEVMRSEGYRSSWFSWSSGEPEPLDWESDEMLLFLRYAAEYPDTCSIALHEYSYIIDDIFSAKIANGDIVATEGDWPTGGLVGRFEHLLDTCLRHNIKAPRIFITEWGWVLNDVPSPDTAMAHIEKAMNYYAHFSQVEGAAIWYLGADFGGIGERAKNLIAPMTSWASTYEIEIGDVQPPIITPPEPEYQGEARVPYERVVWVIPNATEDRYLEIARMAKPDGRTITSSADDAGIGWGLASKTAVIWDIPSDEHQEWLDFYTEHYPDTVVEFAGEIEEPVIPEFKIERWPTNHLVVTQTFGANPDYYNQFGLPGHEGIDIRAPQGENVYAAHVGIISDVRHDSTGHNYGRFVRITHLDGEHETTYAHLQAAFGTVGQKVAPGAIIGISDSTGNSSGSHLHWTLKRKGHIFVDKNGQSWPHNIHDLTPFLEHFPYITPGEPQPPKEYYGPAVTFQPSLHAPGSDWMWHRTDVTDLIKKVNIPVKFLSHGDAWSSFKEFSKPEFHLVRVFWQPDRAKTPQEAWDDVKDGVVNFYNVGARKFELFNEPNLANEGMGLVWENGDQFGQWLSAFIDIMKTYTPDAELYYPGLSPGVPWTNQFSFTDSAWPHVARKLDGACLHAYSGETQDREKAIEEIAGQVIEAQAYRWLDRPLVVSESSVNRAASAEFKAAVYLGVEERLRNVTGIEAVCWFISHWDAPPEQDEHQESWLNTGVSDYYIQNT